MGGEGEAGHGVRGSRAAELRTAETRRSSRREDACISMRSSGPSTRINGESDNGPGPGAGTCGHRPHSASLLRSRARAQLRGWPWRSWHWHVWLTALIMAYVRSSVTAEDPIGVDGFPSPRVLVVAQGGVRSGGYPLYTVDAYRKALDDGAHALECKVGITRRGEAFCVAGMNLEYMSDLPYYRKDSEVSALYSRELQLDANEPPSDGWYIFNFTVAQINKLNLMEEPRSPRALVNGRMRPRFRVPAAKAASLKDVLELALSWGGANSTHPIRLFLEPMYAEFYAQSVGVSIEGVILDMLAAYNLLPDASAASSTSTGAGPADSGAANESGLAQPTLGQPGLGEGKAAATRVAVHIQSREATLLRFLKKTVPSVPLIQILDIDWDTPDAVYPIVEISDKETTEEWRTRCWQEIKSYAWAVAVSKDLLLPRNESNYLRDPLEPAPKGANGPSTQGQPVVYQEAKANGLAVLTWAFCEDYPQAMAGDFSMDPYAEQAAFLGGVGVDGVYTSCPAVSIRFIVSQACFGVHLGRVGTPVGWTEVKILGVIIALLLAPMTLALIYFIHMWRTAERLAIWQDPKGIVRKRVPRRRPPSDESGLLLVPVDPSQAGMEGMPSHEDEIGPPAQEGDAVEIAENIERSSLLSGGDTGKRHSAGTWRMRRGTEWNSDDDWK